MSYEDPTTWELCGVSYEATRKQANDIMIAVMATREWLTYASLKERCNTGDYDACSPEGALLAEQMVTAYEKAFRMTLRVARAALGPDAC